eukprot:PhF_6_TR39022/c0_g1_i1/m.58403
MRFKTLFFFCSVLFTLTSAHYHRLLPQTPSYAILSAFSPTCSPAENEERHNKLLQRLLDVVVDKEVPITQRVVDGVWKETTERSVMVEDVSCMNAIQIAKEFEQEAVLCVASGSSVASVVDVVSKRWLTVGRWVRALANETSPCISPGYTRDNETNVLYCIDEDEDGQTSGDDWMSIPVLDGTKLR